MSTLIAGLTTICGLLLYLPAPTRAQPEAPVAPRDQVPGVYESQGEPHVEERDTSSSPCGDTRWAHSPCDMPPHLQDFLVSTLDNETATCGPYLGPRDTSQVSSFYCMYARYLACQQRTALHQEICQGSYYVRTPCPHC